MVVTEWVSNTYQLPRKHCHSYYKKQQYGFELSHNLQSYEFMVGRKNWLFGFAEGLALSVGAKPMCQLRVGRKTKNAGGAKIKSLRVGLCVCRYVFLVVKFVFNSLKCQVTLSVFFGDVGFFTLLTTML